MAQDAINSAGALDPAALVAVIGAGTMGAGIAQVAATAGHQVVLYDVDAARAEAGIAQIAGQLDRQVAKGRLTADAAAATRARLGVAADLTALAGASLVVEAIVESLAVKNELFARLEEIVDERCLLATNTSSISVTAIGAALARPGRLVGMHFFNPAPVMKLVEVVSGAATDPTAAETVAATAQGWGKVAVHVASTPGFIVNRVARPFYGEAMRTLDEGGVDPATIDAVLRGSGGFAMGPLELTDLIGHDVNFAVTTSVWTAFGYDPRYAPSLAQRSLVESGRLGRKSGHGFFPYGADTPTPEPSTAAPTAAPQAVRAGGGDAVFAPLLDRLRSAGVEVVAERDHQVGIALANGGLLLLTDGRTATSRAADLGAPVVLLDLALDYGTATRFALAASIGCPPETLDDAVGLLQATGAHVSVLEDVPGLLVMRTVAMLVNEAADVVGRGVADRAGVDDAMRFGAGYPVGPMAWGDRLGAALVVTTLDHLADFYRDGRYRACALLRQLAASANLARPDEGIAAP